MSVIKRKVWVILFSCIVFVNLLFVNSNQSRAAGQQDAKVTASILNVRSTPTTKAPILWKLAKGQQVKITQSSNGWAKIEYPKKRDGWVASTYLQSAKKIGYVKADTVTVRSKPDSGSPSKATVHKGNAVTIVSTQGSWYYIQTSQKATGWVQSSIISLIKPAVSVAPSKPKTVYVSAYSLNLRKEASTNSASITLLAKNAKVTELSRSGTWSKITYNNYTGWVANKYLTAKAPVPVVEKPPGTAVPKPPAPVVPKPEPPQAPPAAVLDYVKVISNDVNLRTGPGEKYSILTKANAGQVFRKLGQTTGWIKIQLPDAKEAWVADWLITYNISNTRGLKGKTIVLDAGHGGTDPGSAGYSPSLKKAILEKDLTLKMVQKTAVLLKSAGVNVILTRSTDTYPSLKARVDLSEKYRADAFVSVHYNAGSSTATGVETFYYTQWKDKRLADCIQAEMVKASNLRDRGVKKQSLQVIRENNQPAVLLELGFISNKTELEKILEDSYQEAMSQAIYNGLKNYFN